MGKYLYASISDGFVALCGFGLLFVLRNNHSAEIVSIYLLIRRIIAVIIPAVSLGLPFSLVRYLALCKNGGGRLIVFATGTFLVCIAMLSVPMLSNKKSFALISLGNAGYAEYTLPIIIAVLGLCFVLVSVRMLQGKNQIVKATTWLIFSTGIIPLVVGINASELVAFFIILGLIQLGVSLILIIKYMGRGLNREPVGTKKFLLYGLKSCMCEFVMMMLLWIPPATIAKKENILSSGYFSLMLSMILLLASPLAQIAMVLTPKISLILEKQDFYALRKTIYLLISTSLTVGIILALIGPLIYQFLLPILLNDASSVGNRTYLIGFASIIPLSIFYGLRNIIDVVWSPTRNAYIIAFGIVVFIIVHQFVLSATSYDPLNSVSISFVITIFSIAAISSLHGIHLLKKYSFAKR